MPIILFSIYIIKSGVNFAIHAYYVVPFVPFMALIAAKGLDHIRSNKWQTAVLILICSECILAKQHDFRTLDSDLKFLELENLAEKYIPADAVVLVNGDSNPSMLYFLRRKGCIVVFENDHFRIFKSA